MPDELRRLLKSGEYGRAKELVLSRPPRAKDAEYPHGGVFAREGITAEFGAWLIERGEDINQTDCRGYTPLMFLAGESARPEALKLYVKLGAKLNYNSKTAGTALHAAAAAGQTENAEALLALGIDAAATDAAGRTCLDSAMGSAEGAFAPDYWGVVRLLVQSGVPVTDCARAQLERVCAEIRKFGFGFGEECNRRLDELMPLWCGLFGLKLALPIERLRPEPVRYTKPYAVFNAIRAGELEAVKKLVEEKPELANAIAPKKPTDTKGMSALQVALTTGWHKDVAHYLLERGADVNYPGFGGGIKAQLTSPVLHDAVRAAVSNCRRYCLNDPDVGTHYVWHHTKRDADEAHAFLNEMLEKGANPDIRDEDNANAIYAALFQAQDSDCACFPSVNEETGEPYPGIKQTAESAEDLERILCLLLRAGADANPRMKHSGKTLEWFFGRNAVWSAYEDALRQAGVSLNRI